jgi:hypothetical protein
MQVEIYAPELQEPQGLPRSEGIHLSSVIRVIAVQNGALKPEYVESLDLVDRSSADWWKRLGPVQKARMSIGLAWEAWYVKTQLPHVVHQPGEMQVEGIYMTHDGESLETVIVESREQTVLALHEVKTTSKSINTVGALPENAMKSQWMWLSQTKGYLKGLMENYRLTYVPPAFIHVLFLCGDYSYPISQVPLIYRLQFTEAEVDDNWDIITAYVRHFQRQQAEDLMRDTDDATGFNQ